MGKPVWILLPYNADWRWLSGRNDSPWYPSARLFRQHAIGNWEKVIEEVKSELRTITGCVIASFGVVVGMWLERFLIVVPSLSHKYLPYSWGHYRPRPVEIIIVLSTFAAMTLLYTLFSKFVPIISIWELKVGAHPMHAVSPEEAARHPLGRTHP